MVKEKTVYSRVIEADIQMCREQEWSGKSLGGGMRVEGFQAGVMDRAVARKDVMRSGGSQPGELECSPGGAEGVDLSKI